MSPPDEPTGTGRSLLADEEDRPAPGVRIELRGITKRFPNGVVANEGVDLVLEPGRVHALLGENGAGKSTLVNVLYGLYEPTEGRILVDGRPVRFTSPHDAIDHGIGMVHQHFMLVPVFTVAENLVLGVEPTVGGLIDHRAAAQRVAELSERYGLAVDPGALVEDLPVGVQQRVEILKALYREATCLILDEPTAVLTPAETDHLLEVVETLKADGRSIVFITHKLREVLAVADDISVLRRGKLVGTADPADTDEQRLATLMVGHDVRLVVEKDVARPEAPVLSVHDLRVRDDRGQLAVAGVDLEVRAGEIVAVAGVQGNGQSELVRAVMGLLPVESGSVRLGDDDVTGRTPKQMLAAGVAHLPEDRTHDGLVLPFSIADNLVLNTFGKPPFSRRLRLDRRAIREHAERLVHDYDVRTSSIDAPVSTLSGGNMQKVVAAREFGHGGRLLIAAQPTRGLDVGSIQYIHEQIVAQRDRGVAVLVVSAELDEVLALGDRIAVLYAGRIVGVVDAADADRDHLGMLMAGAT